MIRIPDYIEQDHWRVWLLHYVAKALGVLVHVEGFPYGSNRLYRGFRSRDSVDVQNVAASFGGPKA